MSKAETLIRLNKTEEALLIVNQLRKRAGIKALMTIKLKDIYDERGRQFYWEGFRRQDMIRFDEFLKPHAGKLDWTEPHKMLFPIPTVVLDDNSKIKQNEGY